MTVLGAILAGGEARRFGSDKAQALLDGTRLIDRVAARLQAQSAALIVCGREDARFTCVPDCPEAGLGPLGGLNAALQYGAKHGFRAVLSAPCDVPDLPADIAQQLLGGGDNGELGNKAAIVASQPVIGLWPVELAETLEPFIANGGRSLYGFAEHVGAARVSVTPEIANVNRPEDLKRD